MRYAILADIHSNLAAFQAVLEDSEKRGGFEEIWCLGDVVGYGPDPRECIQLLRQHRHLCIAGNHDWAAIGEVDTSYFNPEAAAACHWTASQLSPEDIDYLRNLPLTLHQADFTLAHGSPREPIWEYVLSTQTAEANFAYFDTRFCLIGHSHVPLIFDLDQDNLCQLYQLPDELFLKQEESRLIINCGGVGQPRDGDPRASYAILDDEKGVIYHYRVNYNISTTQQKMIKAGLPLRLANRLSYGW
ncbi:MAG: metallophosphoesterase [Dehalococcoidia bacterium]|nr:MAG: metallophosphoesterase [Dehalococcoidia bacterium]